jgi:hypothetical protein
MPELLTEFREHIALVAVYPFNRPLRAGGVGRWPGFYRGYAMLKSRVLACVLGLVGMFLAGDVMAMRSGGFGNAPVKDQNWRVGAVDVANLKSRLAYWHGPTSETQFLYRGNTEAFAEAIRLFGLIRAPELELYVHDGPHEDWSLKPSSNETDPEARKRDARVDWAFLIHDAQEWYCWNNDQRPRSAH